MAWQRRGGWGGNILRWLLVTGPFVLIIIFQQQLGISPAIWLVIVVMYLYVEQRTGAIEERVGIANIRSIDDARDYDEPITPHHNVPSPLVAGDWGVTPSAVLFVEHFAPFADVMNEWLDRTAWRIQLIGDADVSELGDGGPVYGYRYQIFLGQVEVGWMSLSDGFDYSLQNPEVIARIQIHDARSYAFSTLTEFLDGVVSHVGGATKDELDRSRQTVRNSMLETIWRVGPYALVSVDDLDVRISGSAQWYLQKARFLPRERSSMDDLMDQVQSWSDR